MVREAERREPLIIYPFDAAVGVPAVYRAKEFKLAYASFICRGHGSSLSDRVRVPARAIWPVLIAMVLGVGQAGNRFQRPPELARVKAILTEWAQG
jgi:hypothetical protein